MADNDVEQPSSEISGPPGDEKLRSTRIRFGLVLVAMLGVVAIIYFANSGKSKPHAPVTVEITYKVEGTAGTADITYEGPGGTAQQSGIDVPLKRKSDGGAGIKFTTTIGHFVYISAQNQTDSGDISCIIEENGIEIARNHSSGGYTIATCSTSA